MNTVLQSDLAERDWVRLHLILLLLVVGVALGVVIIDAQVANFVHAENMPRLRAVFFLSVLTAGLGARSLLARNTSTVDKQGWVFLVVAGMLLLVIAAYGFADCFVEVRDSYELAMPIGKELPRK